VKSRIAVMSMVAALGLGSAVLNAADTKATTTKSAKSNDQAALEKEAKLTRAQAEEIALKKAPGGKVTDAELEREKGKLVWSFDIKTAKPGVTEVLVNAMDGTIVSVTHESPAKEAAEKKQEAKEKKKQ
jgi:uncharacterized membrane protein YkoI